MKLFSGCGPARFTAGQKTSDEEQGEGGADQRRASGNDIAAIVPRRRRHRDAALGGQDGVPSYDLRL